MDISNLNLPTISHSEQAFDSRFFSNPDLNSVTPQNVQCETNSVSYLEVPKLPSPINQCGGALFKYIIHPFTKKKLNIKSKLGKKLLKSYISSIIGGSDMESVFNPNMLTRKFDCSQPKWDPPCI